MVIYSTELKLARRWMHGDHLYLILVKTADDGFQLQVRKNGTVAGFSGRRSAGTGYSDAQRGGVRVDDRSVPGCAPAEAAALALCCCRC